MKSEPEKIKSILVDGDIEKLKSEFEKQKSSLQKEEFSNLVNNALLESDKCNYIDMTIKIVIFLLDQKLSSEEYINAAIKRFNSVLQQGSYKEKHEFKKENKSGKSSGYFQDQEKKDRKEQVIRKIILTLILKPSLKNEIDSFIAEEFIELLSDKKILENFTKNENEDLVVNEETKTKIANIISSAAIKFIYDIDCKNNEELKKLVLEHNEQLAKNNPAKSILSAFYNIKEDNEIKKDTCTKAAQSLIIRAKAPSVFFNQSTIVIGHELGIGNQSEFQRVIDNINGSVAMLMTNKEKPGEVKAALTGDDEKLCNIAELITDKIVSKYYPYSMANTLAVAQIIYAFITQNKENIINSYDILNNANQEFEQKIRNLNGPLEIEIIEHKLIEKEILNLNFFSKTQKSLTKEVLEGEDEKTSSLIMLVDGNEKIKTKLQKGLNYVGYIENVLKEKEGKIASKEKNLKQPERLSILTKEIEKIEDSPTTAAIRRSMYSADGYHEIGDKARDSLELEETFDTDLGKITRNSVIINSRNLLPNSVSKNPTASKFEERTTEKGK